MPLKYFKCPDGITRPINECLEKCARPEGRCLSLPTLYELGNPRTWTGNASTTQLLNPTRQEYLKITKDYAVTPQEMAFALLGTRHHHRLDVVAKKIEGLESEKKLTGAITGILDLLEPDERYPDKWKLTDYKTWGSFSVALIMGIKYNGEYERRQVELQLNHYRIKVEPLGFPISRLFVQCTTRDGGTFTAKNNGVLDKMLMIEVAILDGFEVIEYFVTKDEALKLALEEDKIPPLCDFEERWKGRRCKGELCPIHMYCPEGAVVNKIKLEV